MPRVLLQEDPVLQNGNSLPILHDSPQRKTLSLLYQTVNKLVFCSGGRLSSKAVHYTNILEKIIQNEDCQYFALQDVQKHERLMENRLPTLLSIYVFIICLPQSVKLHDSRDFCLFCSILYLQCLEQCMAHSRCSVNICQMNINYLVHFLMIYLGMTKKRAVCRHRSVIAVNATAY